MSIRFGGRTAAALFFTVSAIATQASAQDAAETGGLEEIVVTAERRVQNLQDVPISATVLSGDALARRGVQNVADLSQVAPSITINQVNRSTYINIRGVGLAQTSPASVPGIAYYVDGQLITSEQFIGLSFFDVGSLEVLRGPQGTLTGQNSTGGAIFMRTPEPRFNEVLGYVDVQAGNFGALRTSGAINLSADDNFAIRIAGVRDVRDSFTKNIGPSESTPGNLDNWAVRANLAMRTTDETVRVNIRAEVFDSNNDNNAVKRRNDIVSTDPFVIQEDARSFMHQRGYRLSGEARAALTDGIELRFLTALQEARTTDQADGDRTATARPRPPAGNVGRVGFTDGKFSTFSNEVNLISTAEGPVNWVVGAFVLAQQNDAWVLRDNNHTTDFVSSTSTIQSRIENNSKSLFGQVNYFATDIIELVAGARHSWDKQTYRRIVSPGGVGDTTSESAEWTGKAGVNLHLTDETMVYVNAAKGYKAGGGNLPLAAASFGPETNFVYELGAKTTTMDGRVRINGAVFMSRYRDIQFASLQNGLPITQNAARGKSWGGELEVTAQFGGLGLNFGAGYLDAQFAEDAILQNTVTNLNELVRKGTTLPFSPEWTLNAGVQYDADFGDMTLTPRVQWSHVSTNYVTPFQSSVTSVPGRHVVDARLILKVNDSWQVEGFLNNLFNETYIATQLQNSSSADGGIIYGAPRTVGGKVTFRF